MRGLTALRAQVEKLQADILGPPIVLMACPLDEGDFYVQGGQGYRNGLYKKEELDDISKDPAVTSLVIYHIVGDHEA